MNLVLTPEYSHYKDEIIRIINNFHSEGTLIGPGSRNIVKSFTLNGKKFNFKSFKQHNFINRHVYKYYRKSKARRSFEYANMLIDKNFHTPQPIAYVEFHDWLGLTNSYYISEQLENIHTLEHVFYSDRPFEDLNEIIKSYTQLIYQLHEEGIEFIDNSPGNFLLEKINDVSRFFMVDLNRMNFHDEFELPKRIKNFSRITNDPKILQLISSEYSLLSGISSDYFLKQIVKAANKLRTKRRIKKVLKFYKYIFKLRPTPKDMIIFSIISFLDFDFDFLLSAQLF
ncbi:lipopolysaccharide kinase InaA family protein [Chryseobacterium paridis]|uniref:Lipopolysaccharide kinase n=1 Tax=Chryseobacterium paridis TaxID=2800328 RepID=A0ABS1FRD3_9FLAO|nr:lipopolysaccharide kinase InaA family protein [Chryseobacterium paridis]MBK1894814.1 lipopolysaccharide kinase [Chryseobacterium paridis]